MEVWENIDLEIIFRYKMLCKETWPSTKGMSPIKVAEKIMASQNVSKSEFQLGKTKIFIRNPTTV
jgi:myosin heavy subunit